ncbi:hypothetical protein YH65_06095 [Sulfurovum lithotrophicum]|uniref:Uncharacterized protein n=1 Tax=Sulfurovum lithotrophicum TaxID=206403 RepID=A0A7U4M1B5_9BACT|nr:hypothetical protein [Sulfurovum lithotrophicum]AKF25010.1 hypothetical protein YH65_06095 [Sulfurovum lithotrophicum]
MKLRLLAAGIAALAFSGCTNNTMIPSFSPSAPVETPKAPVVEHTDYEHASPEKQNLFYEDMVAVATSTKSDPNYHRMALDTPERKAWFKNLMYRLWDGQITKQEFIAEGVSKYPDHRYEFEFVANGYEQRR